MMIGLRILATAVAVALPLLATAGTASEQQPSLSFVVFGDSGYIPAYERFDEDEGPLRTVGEYLTVEVEEHLERNATLAGFNPTPMTFESSLGSFIAASGLYPVAWAMDETCRTQGCDFAAMLGDNIYPDGATLGADGISDARRFEDMLDRPFGRLGAGVPDFTIYSMMGNHDWRVSREATLAQQRYLDEHPNFYMPDLFYRVSPPAAKGTLEIFVIDTEMLLASTTVHVDSLDAEGRERATDELEEWDPHIKPLTDAERGMVAWLDEALRTSTARWKIVLGHHPLWSGGGSKYAKARALRELFLPSLCRYADAYFSGDDHLLEAYTDSCAQVDRSPAAPLPLVVSGAAGKYRPLHPRFMAQQLANNPQVRNLWSKGQVWGFAHAEIEGDSMAVRMISTPADMSGRPVIEAEFAFPRRSAGSARRR